MRDAVALLWSWVLLCGVRGDLCIAGRIRSASGDWYKNEDYRTSEVKAGGEACSVIRCVSDGYEGIVRLRVRCFARGVLRDWLLLTGDVRPREWCASLSGCGWQDEVADPALLPGREVCE